MRLEPVYRPDVAKQLDQLETDTNVDLRDAIVDTLTMICADSHDGTGRAYRIKSLRGDTAVWAVFVPCREPDDWYVLWDHHRDEEGIDLAVLYYVGPLPRGMAGQ